MSNDSFYDLLLLSVDGVPLSSFNSDIAIDLWLSGKQWRPSQQKRKPHKRATRPNNTTKNSSHSEEDGKDHSDSDIDSGLLCDWDSWMTS